MNATKHLLMPVTAILLLAPAVSQAQSLLEEVATTVLTDRFVIDATHVSLLRRRTDLSVYDLAPTYNAAYFFHRRPSTIRQLRNQGLEWGEIAHRVDMDPATFNKLHELGAFDRDRIWTNSYRERFAVPSGRILSIRRAGGSLEDVLGSILVGKLSNKDPRAIFKQFREQRSWTSVSRANNVRFDEWRRVSSPAVTTYIVPREARRSNTTQGDSASQDKYYAIIIRVFEITNAARTRAGAPSLKFHVALSACAFWMAEDMARYGYVDHSDTVGRSSRERAEDFQYLDWTRLGENIAAGQPTPEDVVESWLNSPSHRRNLLDPAFAEIGIGYATSDNTEFAHYWVQAFGARR